LFVLVQQCGTARVPTAGKKAALLLDRDVMLRPAVVKPPPPRRPEPIFRHGIRQTARPTPFHESGYTHVRLQLAKSLRWREFRRSTGNIIHIRGHLFLLQQIGRNLGLAARVRLRGLPFLRRRRWWASDRCPRRAPRS